MKRVYVVPNGRGNNGRKIHTDADCRHIKIAETVVEKDASAVEQLETCKTCNGTRRNDRIGDPQKTRNLLLESDPEDLGLSPIESE